MISSRISISRGAVRQLVPFYCIICSQIFPEYNTCISILTVGYLIGQIPSNMYLTRTKPSYYISFFMALWAIASGLTALAKDFKGLLLTRFFLGVLEAPYYPGALYLLSIFYTRKEIATRICILYTGNILATAFAGLIAAGIFAGMDGRSGIKGWQWLFILLGITTFLVAFGSAFTLPDDPLNTRWLTLKERELAHRRIVSDTVDQQSQTTIWTGLKEAIKDYRLWIFALMQHLHLAANGFKYFFPTVVQTLGFSRLITLVLTCPPYIIAGFICIFWSISSGRSNERTWHIITAKAVAVVGFAIACGTLNVGARYAGMIIFTTGTYAVNSIILGWVGSTCGQTKEKKSASLALVNTISNVSFIWTPVSSLFISSPSTVFFARLPCFISSKPPTHSHIISYCVTVSLAQFRQTTVFNRHVFQHWVIHCNCSGCMGNANCPREEKQKDQTGE